MPRCPFFTKLDVPLNSLGVRQIDRWIFQQWIQFKTDPTRVATTTFPDGMVRKNADNFYTEVKGRKFSIPFFDVDKYDKDLDTDGKEQKDQDGEIKLKKVGSNDYNKAGWEKDSGKIKDIDFTPEPINETFDYKGTVYKPNQNYKNIPNELNEQIDRALHGSLNSPNPPSRKIRRAFVITKLRKYKD